MNARKSSGGISRQSETFSDELVPVVARPFVKWPGGKRLLVPEILKLVPEDIKLYWEPFVGGGAVFFSIADRVERALLWDSNEDLMLAYKVVKNEVEELIEILQMHHLRHHRDSEYYYKVRQKNPRKRTHKAARLIYLNKTGFNGLYRVNSSGKFNVPKGSYVNPTICDESNLRAVSNKLKTTILLSSVEPFHEVVQPSLGDLVYCDPPYHGTFTNYQAGGFGEQDQICLRDAALKWIQLGAQVIVSNNDTPFIRELYSDKDFFKIRRVHAKRPINRNGKGRGAVPEIIVSSKPPNNMRG